MIPYFLSGFIYGSTIHLDVRKQTVQTRLSDFDKDDSDSRGLVSISNGFPSHSSH
jgi:hypothetical protein